MNSWFDRKNFTAGVVLIGAGVLTFLGGLIAWIAGQGCGATISGVLLIIIGLVCAANEMDER